MIISFNKFESIKGTVRSGIGTFKDTVNRFDVGDYIKFTDIYVKEPFDLYHYAKIVGDNSENDIDFPYTTEVIVGNNLKILYIYDNAFDRLSTHNEIEEFELKKAAIKYNIV